MKAYKAKMKKINAHKPKNWKIDPATALINSLYGTLGKRTVFGNLWGGAHGRRLEVVKDTPLKAQKAAKSQRIPPLKARSNKMDAPKAKMEAEKLN